MGVPRRPRPHPSRARQGVLAAAAAALLGGSILVASPAAGVTGGTPAPAVLDQVELPLLDVSPPGANDWSCTPGGEHPEPVVLVHGTFEDMLKNWSTLAPYLTARGHCVFALNYGNNATGPVRESAQELAAFVDAVLGATGARQVDVVGHSQGGMMPRWWMHHLGGARKVDDLVGIAPSSHGTQGVLVALPDGAFGTVVGDENPLCPACSDQVAGSAFMQELNARGDTVPGPSYTVISTVYDEVVTPYTSQFLDGPERQVTNITLQELCPADVFEHDQTPNDPVVHQLVAHALETDGPADPGFRPACLPLR